MKREPARDADWYDAAISDPDSPHLLSARQSPWGELYEAVARIIEAYDSPPDVVDLGCGSGRLAELIHPRTGLTASYHGVDFSAGMLAAAQFHIAIFEANDDLDDPKYCTFERFDLAQPWPDGWPNGCQAADGVFVCLETLEHLDRDTAMLAEIPKGADVILSVPSYHSEAHVRWFPDVAAALRRYSTTLDLRSWERIYVNDAERGPYWHLITGEARHR